MFTQIMTVLGLVLTVAVTLGAVLALIRGSYTKARIQALREDNEDLRARYEDCQEQLKGVKQTGHELSEKVEHLKQENYTLTLLVTQKANVAEVLELLNEHHEQAVEYWNRIAAVLERIATK